MIPQDGCIPPNMKYKKHIDASVKERPQTLLVPSEEICKRVLCNKHIISIRQTLFVRRENAIVNSTVFSVSIIFKKKIFPGLNHPNLEFMFLVYHDLK